MGVQYVIIKGGYQLEDYYIIDFFFDGNMFM